MEKPRLVYQKNVESNTNKMRIPKAIVEKLGKQFYMECYEDKIVLIPVVRKEN